MTNPNDPAFPEVFTNGSFYDNNAQKSFAEVASTTGFTKREQLAAMAMQGVISSDTDSQLDYQQVAKFSVGYADALIEALNAGAKSG